MPVLRPLLHELVLRGFDNQLRHMGFDPVPKWVVIKEPNGSHAADTIVSLLPRSRMLFLLRDGRDVVDSLARRDARLPRAGGRSARASSAARRRNGWRSWPSTPSSGFAARWPASARSSPSPTEQRLLVRYEEILSDTPTQLRRIFDWLDLELNEKSLETIVKRHAFDSAPKDRRGPGKPMRAATPGLWRENLTEDEQRTMHEIMGAKLAELGYDV